MGQSAAGAIGANRTGLRPPRVQVEQRQDKAELAEMEIAISTKQIDKAFLIAEPMRKAAWTKRLRRGMGVRDGTGRAMAATVKAVDGQRRAV